MFKMIEASFKLTIFMSPDDFIKSINFFVSSTNDFSNLDLGGKDIFPFSYF